MRYVYLLADSELDRLFGFKAGLVQNIFLGMASQESYIARTIREEYSYKPEVRDVFVVGKVEGRGLVGKVNVHSRKRLRVNDVSPFLNQSIRLDGSYEDELKKYIAEEGKSDRIVIACSPISPVVKEDIERLVGDLHLSLRAQIFPSRL